MLATSVFAAMRRSTSRAGSPSSRAPPRRIESCVNRLGGASFRAQLRAAIANKLMHAAPQG